MSNDLTHIPPRYRPVGEILSLVGDKWTVLVIVQLVHGKKRFNEIRRQVDGISQKMLASALRGLERNGFVTRTLFAVIPPRVEYELTDLGYRLLESLRALGDFALSNHEAVLKARQRFDAELDRGPK